MKLSLENVKKVALEGYYVEELGEEVNIFVNLEYVDFRWESLLYSNNDILFASLIGKEGTVQLVTNGEVRIFDTENDELYTNGKLSEEIINEIMDGSIYESDRFVLDNNNWFAVEFFERPMDDFHKNVFTDDVVYEAEAEDIDELIKDLVDYYIYFIKEGKIVCPKYQKRNA